MIRTAIVILLFTSSAWSQSQTMNKGHEDLLWYTSPAQDWDHALPVGNGRLGAMVFGNPIKERIQLNEDSLWPGGPEWENSKGDPKKLAEIRALIDQGDVHLADSLIVEYFSFQGVTRSHQTMGDLFIDFEKSEYTDYRRSLDLNTAVAESSYKIDGYETKQVVYSSAADDVIVIKLTTENPDGMDFSLRLSRPEDHGHPTVKIATPKSDQINMKGMVTQFGGMLNSSPKPIDHGVKFETVLKVINESGTVSSDKGQLNLKKVKDARIYIICNTSFYHKDYEEQNRKTWKKIEKVNDSELLRRHVEDYQELYLRSVLDLGHHELDKIPTDTRLSLVKMGKEDINLIAKLFNYGRYLLISSSRPNTNPANLQGIWNEHIEAPWNADYHLNINLQMNYWLAEVTNLSECHMPLFDFSDRLIERGKILAGEQYGMKGAIVHHTTDLWGAPWMRAATPYWGSWIHGGSWLAQHYWEHFQFTQDTIFLEERAYPAISAYAEFYSDWLVKDTRNGHLVSYPETSPENSYFAEDGLSAAVSKGTAMSQQIIAEIFDNTLASAEILGIDNEFTNRIRKQSEQLTSGLQIGPDGRLLEWDQSYEEPEKGHRHISHLYALHPGDDISSDQKDLFEAAQKTIEFRLANGGAGPGWSRAWIINFYARLLDKDAVEYHVNKFMERSIFENLLDIHPPFQIDGNFGFTAGVAEALLQSHEGYLRILPALPDSWQEGNIKGLKARGNITVDLNWKAGELVEIQLQSSSPKELKLVYRKQVKEITLAMNTTVLLDKNLNIIAP